MLKRPVLKPTKIHNGVEASASGDKEKSRDASPAGNPVINDMIHKLSDRMNSAQVEVHLLVNDMDDDGAGMGKEGGVVTNGEGEFSTPRKRGEKGARRPPPISNIDSVSLPSSRSSSFSSSNAPPNTHHLNHCDHVHQQHNSNVNHHDHQQLAYSLPLSSSAETVIPATTSASDSANQHQQYGPTQTQQSQQNSRRSNDDPPPSILQQQTIPPYQPRSGSNVETVYKNYEMLVTRLCSLESTIQSLKLKLASKEVMRECKECFKKSEKLNHLNDAYEKDLHDLRSQVVQSKGEVQNERVLRQSAEIRVKHAESMLDSNTNDKVELSEKLSSMNEVGYSVV